MPGLPSVTVDEWDGCLGLEPDPFSYVGHLVAVFREVWRVLREDGIAFVVLGDSYAQSGLLGLRRSGDHPRGCTCAYCKMDNLPRQVPHGLKQKDLIGIPHRLAFALQADGWYLRNDIVWAKAISYCPDYSGSVMPESVTDRFVRSHEYVFLLAKSRQYFFDQEAVKEQSVMKPQRRLAQRDSERDKAMRQDRVCNYRLRDEVEQEYSSRNPRDVWAINPKPYPKAHYAVFPPALVTPMVLSSTSERGQCPCGTPWRRVVERELVNTEGWGKATKDHHGSIQGSDAVIRNEQGRAGDSLSRTISWQPQCSHDADPVPQLILDPFCGTATTGLVATRHNRSFIGLDLSHSYLSTLARERLSSVQRKLL